MFIYAKVSSVPQAPFTLQRVPAYRKLVFRNQAVQFLINEKKLKREAG